MESQNGMRQPHNPKAAALMLMRHRRMMMRATSMPTVAVVWIQLVA